MSMVVADLHLECITALPAKADSPLVVDPDGVPSDPFPLEGFKMIAGRNPEIG